MGIPLLVGLGNPTVDATVEVTQEYLMALGLEAGTDVAGASMEFKSKLVRKVLDEPGHELTPGGAALNTMRVAKWAAGSAIRSAFLGAVGKDEYATVLTKAMNDVGVEPLLLEVEGETTAVCASLVDTESRDRTLAVVRGAAGCISEKVLERVDVDDAIKNASIIYVTSFVISTPPRAALGAQLANRA